MYYIKYVNYKLFTRFKRQDGQVTSALWSAAMVAPILFVFNIIFLITCYYAFKWEMPIMKEKISFFSKGKIFYGYAIIFVINYMIVYFNKQYIAIFSKFNRIEAKSKYSDFYFFIYFWLSWIGSVLVLLIKKYLTLGYLESPF